MDQAYNMDVDDLFGDGEHVPLQNITATPPVKGLARRVDELASCGCCQKIAWSNNGCVAYISPDGYSIHLKVFSRDTETGNWRLGKPVPLETPAGREVFPFVHLSWSHLGNDLAVVDEAGRVMVFTCANALDRMHFVKVELIHPESEADAIVGMHWLAILPYEQKNQIAWSAERDKDKWKWNIKSHIFHDAHHPLESRASFVFLKRHGELKLRFQQNDNTWHEASAQLGLMMSTEELFTHAAFASNNDNTLLLAAYNLKRSLHLYHIQVAWNVPIEKRNPSNGPIDKPVLQVKLITTKDACQLIDCGSGDLSNGIMSSDVAAAQLTHLNFLPVTPEEGDGSVPTIQAIYCRPPNLISLDQITAPEAPHSIVIRWEVHQAQQNQLHPVFDQITPNKKRISSVSGRTIFLLKRQLELILHSVVLSFSPLWYNMLLAFCYSDGSIEIRKRSAFERITADGDGELVSSLLQAGYAFPTSEPALHYSFSPNYCMAVCMQEDGGIQTCSMEYQHGTLLTGDDDSRHAAALAAFVLQSSTAANQYFASDDIFAVLGTLSEQRKLDFVSLLFDGLNVNIDCGVDDKAQNHFALLSRSPFFVKTLSTMNLLGLNGSVDRSFQSKMAWITLNIKFVTQALTTLTRMHGPLDKTGLRPEVVPQFIGISRWVMHFMAYILDELFIIGRAVQDIPLASLTRPVLEAKFREMNKPAVLLLLSGFPRAMMKLWQPYIAWIKRSTETITNTAAPTPPPELRRLYTPLHVAVNELPFEWRWFEVLISETQNLVRGLYKKDNLTEQQRNEHERDLFLGKIPDTLFPIAKRLVTDSLWNSSQTNGCLADKLDEGRLIFFDTTWLGFQESKRGASWHETHVVDVCQKLVIRGVGMQTHPNMNPQQQQQQQEKPNGTTSNTSGARGLKKKSQLRQCVRCGEYMEDVVQGLQGYAQHHANWLMGVAKYCVCGSSWMLAEEKKKISEAKEEP